MFGGTFKSKHSEKPTHNTRVVIFVDSANTPAGIWEGIIHDVDNFSCNKYGDFYTYKCSAKIIDPRVDKRWIDQHPCVNYDVMLPDEALPRIFARIDEQKKEITGLKRKIKEDREVFHGLFKALVSKETMEKFEEIVGRFIKK